MNDKYRALLALFLTHEDKLWGGELVQMSGYRQVTVYEALRTFYTRGWITPIGETKAERGEARRRLRTYYTLTECGRRAAAAPSMAAFERLSQSS